MAIDLKVAVRQEITQLRRSIAQKSSELSGLNDKLKSTRESTNSSQTTERGGAHQEEEPGKAGQWTGTPPSKGFPVLSR